MEQPTRLHEHWHIDISYIKVCGTFYYLCCILDGDSRAILSDDLREGMVTAGVEVIIERARDAHPNQQTRTISDIGPQSFSKDFKIDIPTAGMTHVKTSHRRTKSNGKIETWHKTAKKARVSLAVRHIVSRHMLIPTQ